MRMLDLNQFNPVKKNAVRVSDIKEVLIDVRGTGAGFVSDVILVMSDESKICVNSFFHSADAVILYRAVVDMLNGKGETNES